MATTQTTRKQNETGHDVNYGSFKKALSLCTSLGAAWAPPSADLSIVKLNVKATELDNVFKNYRLALSGWKTKIGVRENSFAPVNLLMTRVDNIAQSCTVTDEFKREVTQIVKKIKGVRATPKMKQIADPNANPSDTEIDNISAAQTGIDHKLANLEILIDLLTDETNYTPTESELKTATLSHLLTDLKAANTAVIDAYNDLLVARKNRNTALYNKTSGSNETMGSIKKYAKGAFGGNSEVFHDLAKLKITNPKVFQV